MDELIPSRSGDPIEAGGHSGDTGSRVAHESVGPGIDSEGIDNVARFIVEIPARLILTDLLRSDGGGIGDIGVKGGIDGRTTIGGGGEGDKRELTLDRLETPITEEGDDFRGLRKTLEGKSHSENVEGVRRSLEGGRVEGT